MTREERIAREAIKALTSKAGKKGGPARMAKLTPEQRRELSRKAAQARWSKKGQDSPAEQDSLFPE